MPWTWTRSSSDVAGLICHSDAESPHPRTGYTQRLADAGSIASIGSVVDSHDNALAQSTMRLYKTESLRLDAPFQTVYVL